MSELATVSEQAIKLEESSKVDPVDEQPGLIDWKTIWKPLCIITGIFLVFFWLPIDSSRFSGAVIESLALAKWYAQEHVLLCLVPAFFIAVAVSVFVSQAAVMKYLGAGAKKILSYFSTICNGYALNSKPIVFRLGIAVTKEKKY